MKLQFRVEKILDKLINIEIESNDMIQSFSMDLDEAEKLKNNLEKQINEIKNGK